MGDGTSGSPIIVDPDSGGSQDYASLAAAISGEGKDITGDAGAFYIEGICTGGTADGAATLDGFTTDSSHWVEIYADESNGYRWTSGGNAYPASGNYYRIEGTNSTCLSIEDDHVKVFGIAIQATITADGIGIEITNVSPGCAHSIGYCIVKGVCSGSGTGYGIQINDLQADPVIYNTIVHEFVSGTDVGFRGINRNGGTATIYNCTVANNRYGIYENGSNFTVVNCAVFNNSNTDFNNVSSVDHCASDDGTGTNAVDWDNEATDWANVFNDYSNGDFSLNNYTEAGIGIIGQGTDDPGSGLYSDDIIGTSRSSTWDIGAFEYVAAGAENLEGFSSISGSSTIQAEIKALASIEFQSLATASTQLSIRALGRLESDCQGTSSVSAILNQLGAVSAAAIYWHDYIGHASIGMQYASKRYRTRIGGN